jgi:4-carboxymuconolactone decarboxylase
MTDEELKQLTQRTARMLFGDPAERKPGDLNPYEIWKEFFGSETAFQLSTFFTGRLYAREVVSQKQRELCAVAVLTVLHMPEELRAHVKAAMNVGASREEVAEVILQTVTYHGVPTMLEGLKVLKSVMDETP